MKVMIESTATSPKELFQVTRAVATLLTRYESRRQSHGFSMAAKGKFKDEGLGSKVSQSRIQKTKETKTRHPSICLQLELPC